MKPSAGVLAMPDDHVVRVPKEFFFEGMILPVDIFLRMGAETYLVIGRAGEKGKFSELHNFNNPNFAIFVRITEHEKLLNSSTDMTSKIVPNINVPTAVKTKFLSALVKDVNSTLENKKAISIGHLKKVTQLIVSMGQTSRLFDEILTISQSESPDDSHHAMGTCMMSLALAEDMGITQVAALEKIALGAMLHDIGLKFVSPEIRAKPRHLWTPAELQTYENHPLQGVEMVRDLKDIPSDVLLIIAEHHENAQGTGYPKRLRDVRVSPLARIVGMADYFVDMLCAKGDQFDADAAITYIQEVLGQPFNKQVFLALKNLVNKRHLEEKIKKAN